MNFINFLLSNWDSVLVVLAVIAAIIILYRRREFALLEKILFTLVTRAEKEFGSGTGELKKAAVIQWLYERLPKIITIFITPKEIENLIESVLAYAKNKWADNPYLTEYINGGSAGDATTTTEEQ